VSARVVVVGIGNPYRRDDGIGAAVVARLRERAPVAVALVERDGEPTGLLDAWDGASLAVVVDAVVSGSEPGTISRFEVSAGAGDVPERPHRGSSHALGLGDAIGLGRALGRMPQRLVVLAVEAADLGDGLGLSPPVAGAVGPVADRVLGEIAVRAA